MEGFETCWISPLLQSVELHAAVGAAVETSCTRHLWTVLPSLDDNIFGLLIRFDRLWIKTLFFQYTKGKDWTCFWNGESLSEWGKDFHGEVLTKAKWGWVEMYISHRSDFECVFYNERERVCVCLRKWERERERKLTRNARKAYRVSKEAIKEDYIETSLSHTFSNTHTHTHTLSFSLSHFAMEAKLLFHLITSSISPLQLLYCKIHNTCSLHLPLSLSNLSLSLSLTCKAAFETAFAHKKSVTVRARSTPVQEVQDESQKLL